MACGVFVCARLCVCVCVAANVNGPCALSCVRKHTRECAQHARNHFPRKAIMKSCQYAAKNSADEGKRSNKNALLFVIASRYPNCLLLFTCFGLIFCCCCCEPRRPKAGKRNMCVCVQWRSQTRPRAMQAVNTVRHQFPPTHKQKSEINTVTVDIERGKTPR